MIEDQHEKPPLQSDVLKHLIAVSEESLIVHDNVAGQTTEPLIASVCQDMAVMHGSFRLNLAECVEALGDTPHQSPQVDKTAPCASLWKAGKTSENNDYLIDKLTIAEDLALKHYLEATEQFSSPMIRALLADQVNTLNKAHDYLNTMKDTMHKIG